MTPPRPRPLRDVLAMHRDEWDRDETRPAVRDAFAKVVDCGTETLGAEVFASESEERVVYHTCKSRACPSCGYQATRAWQRDQWRELPDVPYAHVCLTMPDLLCRYSSGTGISSTICPCWARRCCNSGRGRNIASG